ncbi:MAG: ATP-binding cassette domain-containing protein [Candidatus Aminicenantes bacterium]|nr:MAG: ATP-binding cassette domain-containing protein [Candidatus Aminicenantes bacterium]
MLQIKDLHYSISDRQLLNGVNWNIQSGKHAALIGPNGIGKTTLLRIIIGELEYSKGTIAKPKEYKIGYLPQEEISVKGTTTLQTVMEGQKEIALLEKQITGLHNQLNTLNPDANSNSRRADILNRLGHLEHRYQALDGYHMETLAKKILSGLGFRESDFSRPLSEFSGGWRMRVYLALLLVQQPDLLLLDEPTNHLDLPSLEWLEQYLLDFPGSIVAVSHDRFFIDRIAREIVELDRGKLEHYPGNYHFYENQKEQKETLLLKKWKEQKEERERQERFINRFRYKASKAKQVQSRIKQLEKMETIEPEPPPQQPRHPDFNLSVEVTSYNDVLTIENMAFKYDKEWVFKDIDLNIYRGDRICLVGPNGAGKTTLTRLIVRQIHPQEGMIRTGERTTIGYYAQHQVDTLDVDNTVCDEVASTVATSLVPKIRDVLGIFQFSGNDVYKKIKVLSGGEKARVSLAKILISPVNFLIMDEPTNHLDKFAREALERALIQYNGTLLLISHDRYFLDKIVNRVVEIRNGNFLEYDGNYSYYLEKRESLCISQPISKPGSISFATPSPISSGKKTKEQKRLQAEARQAVSKERNRLQREVEKLEEKIEQLEKRKDELETQMAHPDTYDDSELAVRLQKEYAAINKELIRCNQEWEQASTQLEEIIRSI